MQGRVIWSLSWGLQVDSSSMHELFLSLPYECYPKLGAGKSTLLDVIAGKKTTGWITGDLLINGKPRDEFFPRFAGKL